ARPGWPTGTSADRRISRRRTTDSPRRLDMTDAGPQVSAPRMRGKPAPTPLPLALAVVMPAPSTQSTRRHFAWLPRVDRPRARAGLARGARARGHLDVARTTARHDL